MKLDKAPTESYGDIGGLDLQIQEIKVRFSFSFSLALHSHTNAIRRRPSNSLLPTQNSTRKWASNLQRVSFFMVSQEQARLCSLKLLLIQHLQHSCVSLVVSSSKSIWVMARSWSASCSELRKNTPQVSSSLMRSMPLVARGASEESPMLYPPLTLP